MGQPAKKIEFPYRCTLGEYFKLAEESLEKLEYRGSRVFPINGEIVAMAEGTEYHSLIIGNIGGVLWNRLCGKDCRFYTSEFRVGVREYPTYTYTDGHVICGPTQLDEHDPTKQTALNPTLIVEVFSPSTEGYDRGGKFIRYMHADSLQEYVLVSQNTPRIDVFFRQTGGTWLLTPYVGTNATAVLRSIDLQLPLFEVYLNVIFPPDADEPTPVAQARD